MTERFVKRLLIGILGLVGIGLLGAAGANIWYRRVVSASQPQVTGHLAVEGIGNETEIIRDVHGIPHIYASSERDLFFAMGFAMAQDRLWQMEFYRRVGSGRLSEILGEEALEADRFFRTIEAAVKRKNFPKELAFIGEAYTAGVNAFIDGHRDSLPLEFKLLSFQPEPWRVEDFQAVATVINWGLSIGWKVDLVAAAILKKVGQDLFAGAFPATEEAGPAPAVHFVEPHAIDPAPILFLLSQVSRTTALSPAPASNNWVLSGTATVSGKPLLANDTHMPLSNPGLWWEVHLICPTIDAAGFAIPGLPGLVLGRNRHVAWGVTNVMVDDVDFYVEQRHPQNPWQYRFKDRWEDMRSVRQTIRVKDAPSVVLDVRLTRHGPILEMGSAGKTDRSVSARWAYYDLALPVRSAYLLLKAANAAAVIEALSHWDTPGQNFVFADTDGTIGFWCCTAIPRRSRGSGLLPLSGWTGADEWDGYVAFADRPHAVNPQEGFIATANDPPATGNLHPLIGTYWEPIDRISRIRGLIGAKPRLSAEDVSAMQADVLCPLAAEMVPAVLQVIDERLDEGPIRDIRDLLNQWDFRMTSESAAAAVFESIYLKMLTNIFSDELGEELFQKYIGLTVFAPRALRKILRSGTSAWLDDRRTPVTETLTDIIAMSVRQALQDLRQRLGPDANRWRWGRLHTLTFRHALGRRKLLDRLFNLGPFPVSGNHLTINKTQYDYRQPFAVTEGVSQRMVVDLADPATALHVLPTGESGLLGNPHIDDQVGLYLKGDYHPSWLNRVDIERNAEGILVLMPR